MSEKYSDEEAFCDDEAVLSARKAFGIKYLYPWQRLVVANIMDAFRSFEERKEKTEKSGNEPQNEGEKKGGEVSDEEESLRHQILLLPTGAGKSLCFQIPALLLPGPTLIIYPLLALMSDQERRMTEGSLKSVVFRGGQTEEEREENFRRINNGEAKIIIANPEILSSEKILMRLKEGKISHIAIDEAHCVSEWGDTFRKSYLELGRIIEFLDVPVVTAFTATASPEVLSRVSEVLFKGNAHLVRSESDRPNIRYFVKKVVDKKKAVLFLSRSEQKPMIVFCGTRRRTEDVSRELNFAFGPETSRFYHAGMEREEKTKIEKWFFDKKDAVLVATCAFGMGVDKSDIRTVIHYDPPKTAEAYIQEAGRGGRDRERADAILLWNEDDYEETKDIPETSRFSRIRRFALSESCRRQELLDALGAEQAVCSGCDICDEKKRSTEKSEWKKAFIEGSSDGEKSGAFRKLFHRALLFSGIKSYEKSSSFFRIPGDELSSEEKVMLETVRKGDRFYTKETLEEEFIKKMNERCLPFTGINIWDNSGFEGVFKSLLKNKKIRILRFPWKNRISICKK